MCNKLNSVLSGSRSSSADRLCCKTTLTRSVAQRLHGDPISVHPLRPVCTLSHIHAAYSPPMNVPALAQLSVDVKASVIKPHPPPSAVSHAAHIPHTGSKASKTPCYYRSSIDCSLLSDYALHYGAAAAIRSSAIWALLLTNYPYVWTFWCLVLLAPCP